MAMTETPLTMAQQVVKDGESLRGDSRANIEKCAIQFPDLVITDEDSEAESTTYIFKDSSRIIFEPHTYEVF